MRKILLAVFLFIAVAGSSQQINIIPQPKEIQTLQGVSFINSKTVIVANDSLTKISAAYLADYIKTFYRIAIKIQATPPQKNFIRLVVKKFIVQPKTDGYSLTVSDNNITISGDTYAAVFYGVQTMVQLLPVPKTNLKKSIHSIPVPNINITDEPRFAYRGMHLDVSRHFFPVSFVKKYIDYLALHKFNTFHWHLTDDQGWRIEIKKYPKLTTIGAWRNGTIVGRYPGKGNDSLHYGGYYTQEQIKEVVKYAARRFITVIPEIEMPGHSSAAIAAYPQLSCFPGENTQIAKGTAWYGPTQGKQVQQAWGVFEDIFCAGKESTFEILEKILDEVVQLFPGKYIHIGGDECPKANWKRCPYCQQRITSLGLKNEHELQSYFTQRIEKYLNSKGKQIIGWDEILEGGLAQNATVMSWRGEQGGIDAAKQNHDVVMTPGGWCYFDHSQSNNEDSVTIGGYTPIEKIYSYDPVPNQLTTEEAKHILGAQANLWTEYISNTRKVEYMIFPRIAALSEVLWTIKDKKDSANFEKKLKMQFKRYDLWKVNYSKAFWEINDVIYQTNNKLMWQLTSKHPDLLYFDVYKKSLLTKKDTLLFYDENKNKFDSVIYKPGDSSMTRILPKYKNTRGDTIKVEVNGTGNYAAYAITGSFVGFENVADKYPFQIKNQAFYFNKATGKKIVTIPPPSSSYPGNGGAIGLVNGIRADKFASPEWLGWNGSPVEIRIDLDKKDTLNDVRLHVWKQEASWIYLPMSVEVLTEDENGNKSKPFIIYQPVTGWPNYKTITIPIPGTVAKIISIKINPLMKIPEGSPGAGNAAWIFLDEIEIN